VGESVLTAHGAVSAPRKDYKFPGATCISINDAVAHGIPGDYRIQPGDWINLDVSACLGGFYADTGFTLQFRGADPELGRLAACSRRALKRALGEAKSGARLNRVGLAIEREAMAEGFTTVRNLSGHGVGRKLHEAPEGILNYYEPRQPGRFHKGQVVAIETFVSTGADEAVDAGDGWTLTTEDGSRVAQYEHSIVITDKHPLVLTRVG
jgi:methionyl aminopeptidase